MNVSHKQHFNMYLSAIEDKRKLIAEAYRGLQVTENYLIRALCDVILLPVLEKYRDLSVERKYFWKDVSNPVESILYNTFKLLLDDEQIPNLNFKIDGSKIYITSYNTFFTYDEGQDSRYDHFYYWDFSNKVIGEGETELVENVAYYADESGIYLNLALIDDYDEVKDYIEKILFGPILQKIKEENLNQEPEQLTLY